METLIDITDREITSTRLFDAHRKLVFRAWSNPELLAKWWGPKGFTNTFHEFEFKPGGTWKFTMHGADGTDYPNRNVFDEIIEPEKIVFTHFQTVHTFQVTATFEAIGNQTKLIFYMLFESAEECKRVKPFVINANEENFDKLEEVINRNKN